MEFIFTRDTMMWLLLLLLEDLECIDVSGVGDADPTEATRRPGPGESEITLSR